MMLQVYVDVCVQECRSICARGIVVQVLDKAFDVLIHNYGVIKRVYCDVCVDTAVYGCGHIVCVCVCVCVCAAITAGEV